MVALCLVGCGEKYDENHSKWFNELKNDKTVAVLTAGTPGDFELSKEQINNEKLFENAPAFDKESRNIYYTYLQNYARKSFRRSSLELNSIDLKHLIEKFIIEIKQTYEIFDVYLATEYTKAINKKFILRGEYKHYKLYFDGIRKILHQLNMIVRKMLNFS